MNLFALVVLAGLAPAAPPSSYTVTPLWDEGKAEVKIEASTPQASFTIPSWREGDYQIFKYSEAVQNVEFRNRDRIVEGAARENGSWSIPKGATSVRYTALPSSGNFSPNLRVKPGELWLSGPVFGWLGEPARPLKITIPAGPEMKVYTSLPWTRTEDSVTITARSHRELMDSPILVSSTARAASFEVDRIPHTFVAFGDPRGVDEKAFAETSRKIVSAARDLVGKLPYDRYFFFADFRGGLGGLEHHASTRIGLGTTSPQGAAGMIAHEHFHSINVKKIIPREFASLDFTRPTVTDSLWWLEGVTDYYADVDLARCGLRTKEQVKRSISRAIWSVEMGSARKKVALSEASRKVWLNDGSWGYDGLSYYEKGKIVGFLLDLSIRTESGGAKSLDSVLASLYQEAEQKQGYAPGRIRELVLEHGGPKSAELYDLAVDTTKDIPWDEVLKPYGMMLSQGVIVERPDADAGQKMRWQAWPLATKAGTDSQKSQL